MKQILYDDKGTIITGNFIFDQNKNAKLMEYTIIIKNSISNNNQTLTIDNVRAHFAMTENTKERIFITEERYPIYIIMTEDEYDTFHDNIMKYCK